MLDFVNIRQMVLVR